MTHFSKFIFITILLSITSISCQKDDQNPFYSNLIDKNWVSSSGTNQSYCFYTQNKYRRIWETAVLNPENNSVSFTYDTIFSYWRLNNDIIEFSSTQDFSGDLTPQLNFKIIDLTPSTLKVKYLSDLNDSSILPLTFQREE